MNSYKLTIACILTGCSGVPYIVADVQNTAAIIQNAQSLQREWMQNQRLISSERADWQVQKVILSETIALLEQEKLSLKQQMEMAEETASIAEKERASLEESKEALKLIEEQLRDSLSGQEAQLRDLLPRFPDPLKEELGPVLARFPSSEQEAKSQAVTARLQNIILILGELDKFNDAPTKVESFRTIPTEEGEREAQVFTLYMGLGIAYFVDSANRYAGYGRPMAEGWEWTVDASLAEQISRLLAVYDNRVQAEFIALPVAAE